MTAPVDAPDRADEPDVIDDEAVPAIELPDEHRQAITAAVPVLVRELGTEAAYWRALPAMFQTPGALRYASSLVELPLDDEGLTAAATTLPPKEWFEKPGGPMPPGSGHFVEGQRVWGRLAEWDVPHIGVDGRPVFAPRSPSNYHWFHRKGTRVQGPSGVERLKIGHLTFDIGHAPTQGVSWQVASGHYDDSRYRAARVRMYEDDIGPWYAGALCAGIEGDRLERFEESDTSGDWRAVMGGPLDLVAALCVNVGGFPKVGLALAASGEPLALVAAGKRHHAPELGVGDPETFAAAVVAALDAREERAALLAELGQNTEETEEAEILRLTLLEDDDDEAVAELVAAMVAAADLPSTMPLQLQESYLTGKVARRIKWRTPGDMTRCMAQAKAHGMGRMAAGACARLHKIAVGYWPGDRRNL